MFDSYPALRFGNYRAFLGGQSLSLIGSWMQQTTATWMILEVTGSGTMVGIAAAAQTLPMLLLSPYAGVQIDRRDKRKVLIATQTALAAIAVLLGLLVATDRADQWSLLVVCLLGGLVSTIDNPARQSFVIEMVDDAAMRSALGLTSVSANFARLVGPAIAGVMIGAGQELLVCLINAITSVAVIAALSSMNRDALTPSIRAERVRGQVRDGLRYVHSRRRLLVPMVMMTLIGTFTYNFTTVLPLLSRFTFGEGPELFGLLTAVMGLGAVVGGLVTGRGGVVGIRSVAMASLALGISMATSSMAPNVVTLAVALFVVGACECSFYAAGSTTLQLQSDPEYRARVSALWGLAFRGSTPVGAPIAGAVATASSPRLSLAMGALAALVAARIGFVEARRQANDTEPADETSGR